MNNDGPPRSNTALTLELCRKGALGRRSRESPPATFWPALHSLAGSSVEKTVLGGMKTISVLPEPTPPGGDHSRGNPRSQPRRDPHRSGSSLRPGLPPRHRRRRHPIPRPPSPPLSLDRTVTPAKGRGGEKAPRATGRNEKVAGSRKIPSDPKISTDSSQKSELLFFPFFLSAISKTQFFPCKT